MEDCGHAMVWSVSPRALMTKRSGRLAYAGFEEAISKR